MGNVGGNRQPAASGLTGGSRLLAVGGVAALGAADELIESGKNAAAQLLEQRFDLLVAVLNHDSVDLRSIDIDHVLRLTPGFFRAGPLHFEESEISDARERNDCQDERVPPIHVRRDVATKRLFQWQQESMVLRRGESTAGDAMLLGQG